MPIDPRLLRRVEGCFRLSRDSGATEHEALVALELAKKMLAEHNLTLADVEAARVEHNGEDTTDWKFAQKEGARAKKEYVLFEKLLHQAVATICSVQPIYWQMKRDLRLWTLVYVGEEQDVAVACSLLKLLAKAMRRSAREVFGDNWTAMHKHYCSGFSMQVAERAERMAADLTPAEEKVYALVVQGKESRIQKRIEKEFPNVRRRPQEVQERVDPIAFALGSVHGKKVSLGRNQIAGRR